MQKVFRSLAVIAVIALFTAPLSAEDKAAKKAQKGGAKGDPTAQALGFLKKVELTDEQKAKIEEIKAAQGPKVAEAQKAVNQVLTPDARKKAAEARKQAQTDGKKGKEVQEAVRAALNLSADDAAKYDKAQAALAEVTTTLRNDVIAVLTDEQRTAAGVKVAKKKKAAAS